MTDIERLESLSIPEDCEMYGTIQRSIEALRRVEEFEKAGIIMGGRLNGRTWAYKCGYRDAEKKRLEECGDCISRDELIYELDKLDWQELYLPVHFYDMVTEMQSVMPTDRYYAAIPREAYEKSMEIEIHRRTLAEKELERVMDGCDDCISRKDVAEEITKLMHGVNDPDWIREDAVMQCYMVVMASPRVKPREEEK